MREMQRLEHARALCDAKSFRHEDFLALLSHEMRTPLGALLTASEVLGAVTPGSPDDLEARAVVTRQARRLRYVLDELLQIGRAIQPQQEA